MNDLLIDTHVLVWHLTDANRLSPAAVAAIESTRASGGSLFVSTISLIEILYLQEKGKIPPLFEQIVTKLFATDTAFLELPVTTLVAASMREISLDAVPDLPDRIIAGTAKHLGIPLVTHDLRIRSLSLETIW